MMVSPTARLLGACVEGYWVLLRPLTRLLYCRTPLSL